MSPTHRPRGAPDVPPDLPPEYVDAYLEGYRRAYDPGVSGGVHEQGGAPAEERSEQPEAGPTSEPGGEGPEQEAAAGDRVETPAEEPVEQPVEQPADEPASDDQRPEDDWPELIPGMRSFGVPSGLRTSDKPRRPPLQRGERPLWVLVTLIAVLAVILMLGAYALGKVLADAAVAPADPGRQSVVSARVSPR